MKRIALTVAALAFASMASAHNCPNEVKAIDAALPKAKLDAKQTAEVKQAPRRGRAAPQGRQAHRVDGHPRQGQGYPRVK